MESECVIGNSMSRLFFLFYCYYGYEFGHHHSSIASDKTEQIKCESFTYHLKCEIQSMKNTGQTILRFFTLFNFFFNKNFVVVL